jgi:chemotaxis protein MotA
MVFFSNRQLDVGTIFGILAAFGLVFYAIQLGGDVSVFLDLPSVLIVLGGTFGATLINHPLAEIGRTFGLVKTAFFPDRSALGERVARVLHFSRRLRSEDVTALRSEFEEETDPFFRQCLELLLEGVEEHEIRRVMEIELSFLDDRHRRGARLFSTMGTIAPAMGLVGTLIGLIQMLQSLDTPSRIGPAMSVALLTTFYGALFANVIFIPFAGKLRTRSEEEFLAKELTIEGVVCLAQRLNPKTIERRLHGFLPGAKRISEYQ